MSNVIPLKFSARVEEPTQEASQKPPADLVPSQLEGGFVAYLSVDDANIDEIGAVCKHLIDTCPGELVLVLSKEMKVTGIHSFEKFIKTSMQIFDNIYNDVIMGSMANIHDGISSECRDAISSELTGFVCRVKHMVATGLFPVAGFVIQFSVSSIGLLFNCVYGTPDKANSHLPVLTFPFKLKED